MGIRSLLLHNSDANVERTYGSRLKEWSQHSTYDKVRRCYQPESNLLSCSCAPASHMMTTHLDVCLVIHCPRTGTLKCMNRPGQTSQARLGEEQNVIIDRWWPILMKVFHKTYPWLSTPSVNVRTFVAHLPRDSIDLILSLT